MRIVKTDAIKTFGMVSWGLITLSAGTVAVSMPINDHITRVVTVASNEIGCRSVGLNSGRLSILKFAAPRKIIKIRGNNFNRVEISWNLELFSKLLIFRIIIIHTRSRDASNE